MPIEEGEVKLYFRVIDEKLDGINQRLDILNGKTNSNSTRIAILDALREQDRQNAEQIAQTAQNVAHTTARNSGALWGSLGGTVLVVAGLVYRWVTGNPLPLN